jgi:hypothetical protein
MRAVRGPDPVSVEGRFYRIPEADIGAKPVRPDGPTDGGAGSTTAAELAERLGVGLTLVIFEWDTIRETSRPSVRRPAPQSTTPPRMVRDCDEDLELQPDRTSAASSISSPNAQIGQRSGLPSIPGCLS